MKRPLNKRELDILEERGLWEASSSLHRLIKRLIRKNLPVEIGFIKQAHKTVFTEAKQPEIAGKYRQDNDPELKRVDGTVLPMADWRQVPNEMAKLDVELREATKNLRPPKTFEDYSNLVSVATRLSHRLACIHPFKNGNGRSSRLLFNAIFLRAGLPEISIKTSKPAYLRAMNQADYGDFSVLEKIIISGLLDVQGRNYSFLMRKRSELGKGRKK